VHLFCTHLKKTTIISLHGVNLLVFITETECVYCAVRTEALNIIRVSFSLGRVKHHSMKIWVHGGIDPRIFKIGTKWEFLNLSPGCFIHRKKEPSIHSSHKRPEWTPELLEVVGKCQHHWQRHCQHHWQRHDKLLQPVGSCDIATCSRQLFPVLDFPSLLGRHM